jgi:hypothetical protein
MGWVGLAHVGCRLAAPMSAKPPLEIQPEIDLEQEQTEITEGSCL